MRTQVEEYTVKADEEARLKVESKERHTLRLSVFGISSHMIHAANRMAVANLLCKGILRLSSGRIGIGIFRRE